MHMNETMWALLDCVPPCMDCSGIFYNEKDRRSMLPSSLLCTRGPKTTNPQSEPGGLHSAASLRRHARPGETRMCLRAATTLSLKKKNRRQERESDGQ